MDAGAFVQENKRWLVGCAIGGLVWWIATMVVDSVFSTAGGRSSRGALTNAYSAETRDELVDEGEALAAELANLKTELAFVVAPEYSQWSGDADGHLFLQGRKLKRAVSERASDRDVTVDEKDLVWDSATGIDQIRAILFGLDIINEIQTRLFAAHDATKEGDEDALGLYEIESIKLEPIRNRRSRGRGRRGEIDISDWVSQQTVSLVFHADEPTIATFLETCRKPNRTLILDKLQITKPARPGEPGVVKATLSGITFLERKEEE